MLLWRVSLLKVSCALRKSLYSGAADPSYHFRWPEVVAPPVVDGLLWLMLHVSNEACASFAIDARSNVHGVIASSLFLAVPSRTHHLPVKEMAKRWESLQSGCNFLCNLFVSTLSLRHSTPLCSWSPCLPSVPLTRQQQDQLICPGRSFLIAVKP